MRALQRQRFADEPFSPRQPRNEIIPGRIAKSFVLDLSAGFGVVCPMLAFYEAGTALGQWSDQTFAATHAAVPAEIESLDDVDGGRTGSFTRAVIAYRPSPSAPLCRVTIKSGPDVRLPAAGESITVVPRAEACGIPVIRSQIGNPTVTLTIALVLLAAGLASLRLWMALERTPGWSRNIPGARRT